MDLARNRAEDYFRASQDDPGGRLRGTTVEELNPLVLESRCHSAHGQASMVQHAPSWSFSGRRHSAFLQVEDPQHDSRRPSSVGQKPGSAHPHSRQILALAGHGDHLQQIVSRAQNFQFGASARTSSQVRGIIGFSATGERSPGLCG